ncbi:Polynucleotide adenylyltransferase region domain protein [Candidatus Magnetobacterium bavaricum]|uniref:Polynucleotide adenylyltransferase region domain protein n=1 Tax=Candidatus Magnetobacterium bavaricum TaxID=29290 RepID=A0A0F3GUJ5_9BACT|nr:Polynucleotide adenylyltransferase region domain protein [Candidatus Magnetobacterium bavaricum]
MDIYDRYYSENLAELFLKVENNVADYAKYEFTSLGQRVEEKIGKVYKLDDKCQRKLKIELEKKLEGVDTFSVMESLYLDGYDIWIVGGAVRSVLLANQKEEGIKDLDIAGTAPMSVVKKKIKHIGKGKLEGIPTGGGIVLTAKTNKDEILFEYAPLKLKYHETNETDYIWLFDHNMEADSCHRDLTINTIFYNPFSGCLFDPTGDGLADIKSLTIRLTKALTQAHPDGYKTKILFRLIKFVDKYEDAKLEINDFKENHLEECYTEYMGLPIFRQKALSHDFLKDHKDHKERRIRFIAACKKIEIEDVKINELSKHIG